MAGSTETQKATSLELSLYLGEDQALALQDPDVISQRIVEEILKAETPEALLARSQTTEARDVLSVPLHITDVSYNPSALEEGVGVYALVTAQRIDTDEEMLITCGARNVMAQLFRAKQQGWLPLRCKLVETDKATARGFRPMSLVPYTKEDDAFANE